MVGFGDVSGEVKSQWTTFRAVMGKKRAGHHIEGSERAWVWNISIPKLELESVALQIELYREGRTSLGDIHIKFVAYKNNTLAWIRSHNIVKWRVPTIRIHHHPPDSVSRETDPRKFVGYDLWFTGNPFVRAALSTSPFTSGEVRTNKCCNFITQFPSWKRLVNTIVRCLRRICNKVPAEDVVLDDRSRELSKASSVGLKKTWG